MPPNLELSNFPQFTDFAEELDPFVRDAQIYQQLMYKVEYSPEHFMEVVTAVSLLLVIFLKFKAELVKFILELVPFLPA